MPAPAFPSRLLLALAAWLSLAACGGTVDFSIERDLTVDWSGTGGSTTATYDLAADAGSAWKHRDKISSVTITSGEATVTALLPDNAATAVSGELWLLPENALTSADPGAVKVGAWTGEPVTQGNVIPLVPTPALDAFVRDAFNGSGRFSVYATGDGGGQRVNCTLHVVLGAKLKWKAF